MKPTAASQRICHAILAASAALGGCASTEQAPEPPPAPPAVAAPAQPSPEALRKIAFGNAHQALEEQRFSDALAAYQAILDNSVPGTTAYHQACVGMIASLTAHGDNPVRNIEQALQMLDRFNASMAQADREATHVELLSFSVLKQLLELEFSMEKLQNSLTEEQARQKELQRENQQLQEALFKLRRLSLE